MIFQKGVKMDRKAPFEEDDYGDFFGRYYANFDPMSEFLDK